MSEIGNIFSFVVFSCVVFITSENVEYFCVFFLEVPLILRLLMFPPVIRRAAVIELLKRFGKIVVIIKSCL